MSCPNPCPQSCSECNDTCPSTTICYSCLNPLTPAIDNKIYCADCQPEFINRALEFSFLLNFNMGAVFSDSKNNVTYVPLLAYALYQSTLKFEAYVKPIKSQDVNLNLLFFDYIGNDNGNPNYLELVVFSGTTSLVPLPDPPSNNVFADFIHFFQAPYNGSSISMDDCPTEPDQRCRLLADYTYMTASDDGFLPSVQAVINNSNNCAGADALESNLTSLYCNLEFFLAGNSNLGTIGNIASAITNISNFSTDYANGLGDGYVGALQEFLNASPTDLPGSSKESTIGLGSLVALSDPKTGSLGLLQQLINGMTTPTNSNIFLGLVDLVYKNKHDNTSYICPAVPSNGDADNSIGFSQRANELALLFYQQNYFAPPINRNDPETYGGLGCYALWESFNNMNAYMNYISPIEKATSPNAYELNNDMWMQFNENGKAIMPASVPNDPTSIAALCLGMIDKPGGLDDMVGVFNTLFGFTQPTQGSSSLPNSGPQTNNCFKDCGNSTAYTAIANLITDMTGYVPDATNQTKLTTIASHILAFNTISGLTDGYLTALTLYINALSNTGTPKVPSISMVQASTAPINFSALNDLISTTSTLKNTNTSVNVFSVLLQNIMTLEFGLNATEAGCSQSPTLCKGAFNGCVNLPSTSTYVTCNDGTCCAQACNADNTCCGKSSSNPLGLPGLAGKCS